MRQKMTSYKAQYSNYALQRFNKKKRNKKVGEGLTFCLTDENEHFFYYANEGDICIDF